MFQAPRINSVRIFGSCSRWKSPDKPDGSFAKCLTKGGFLQCPASRVNIRVSGKKSLTCRKISSKLALWLATWNAKLFGLRFLLSDKSQSGATICCCKKPLLCPNSPASSFRYRRIGGISRKCGAMFLWALFPHTGIQNSICRTWRTR